MPTYDYECDACGHKLEVFQSISEPVKRKCPECGKLKLRRLFGTGGAIVFKGSGFYETDYRSESYKKAEKAEKKSEGGDGKKGDAKPGDKKAADKKSGDSSAAPKSSAKSSGDKS